jgi:5'-nucleotidase
MRLPNDRILAECCPQIDLILGGHDHSSVCEVVNSVTIIKSGSDFEEFSDIHVDLATKKVSKERIAITDQFKPDPAIVKHVSKYTQELDSKLNQVCGYIDADIEGRFELLRSQETNMGNWIADLLYTEFPVCDIVILNGGTLRSNCVLNRGHITLKTVSQMLPMPDKIV